MARTPLDEREQLAKEVWDDAARILDKHGSWLAAQLLRAAWPAYLGGWRRRNRAEQERLGESVRAAQRELDARLAALPQERGVVFNPPQQTAFGTCVGTIERDGGDRIRFYGSAYLREGQRVEFGVEETARGPEAVHVRPLA